VGQFNQKVELAERRRVEIARARLEPGPEQIEAHRVVTQRLHGLEIFLNAGGVPLRGPLQRGHRRHPMRAYGQKRVPVFGEIVAF
jgi:hypothetical protein